MADLQHAGPCSAGIDVTSLTITAAVDGMRAGTFTSEQLVQAHVAQLQRCDPIYNAMTAMNPRAVEQARASDARRRARVEARAQPEEGNAQAVGAMEGVPVVIKEALDHVDMPSTFGWVHTAPRAGCPTLYPQQNAIVVQRLLDAGAIILGKTNIPAYSNDNTRVSTSWAGPTLNAVNRELVPGASSAGTATAVATGCAVWGVAEETGGSIQNPASVQSLAAVKPTFGLIPTQGLAPLATSTRDVVGPIARCVRDAALALDVLAGHDRHDCAASVPEGGYAALLDTHKCAGRRFGLYGPGWKAQPLSSPVQMLYAKMQGQLRSLGAELVPDPFEGSGFAALRKPNVFYDDTGMESLAHDLHNYVQGLGFDSWQAFEASIGHSPFGEGDVLNWYIDSLPLLKESLKDPSKPIDLSNFKSVKAEYLHIAREVFAQHKLDALAFPQALVLPPELHGRGPIRETTVSEINIAGLPAVTVPSVSFEVQGRPVPSALLFVGLPNSESELLALAYDYEQATQLRIVPQSSSQ